MASIVMHGLKLAAGAVAENFHVERLVADPSPVSAGRQWFNETEKKFKYSSLNGAGAVVVLTFQSLEEMSTSLSDYIKKDGSVAFTGNIDAGGFKLTNLAAPVNGTDATTKTYVDGRVEALGNAFNYVGTVAGGANAGAAYDLDTLAAGGKDSGDYYKVSTSGHFKIGEAGTPFYANVGDGLVWNMAAGVDIIDNTDSTVSEAALGDVAVTGSADVGFVVDLKAAFKSKVSQLETDRGTMASLTTTEKASLVGAINELDSDLGVIEGQVNGKIGDLTTLTTDAKNTVVAALNEVDAHINTEIDDRGTADTLIRTDVNSRKFTFQASAAAVEHTITHNLNSAWVIYTVMTEGTDGKYRNDIVPVEEIDLNSMKVYLSESRKVKVSVLSMVSI
jgi:hypothetical protein